MLGMRALPMRTRGDREQAGGRAPARPLQRRVLSAATWVVVSRVATRALRLGSNLILTRLLYPEAFGIVAIVYAVIDGVEMFSDAGVKLSVVQDEEGEDPRFLNTAWTIQAARGFSLWGVTALLAWPLASLYNEPLLGPLLAIAGGVQALRGLNSMSMARLQRNMAIGKLTLVELATQPFGVGFTVAYVWLTGSIWGLVLGPLVGSSIRVVVSHLIAESPRHRFMLDPEARRSIYQFGRWVLFATPFTYVVNQGDRLLLGRFLSMEELGLFAIAAILVKTIQMTHSQMGNRVLFPLYVQIGRETSPTFRRRIGKVRLGMMAAFLPALWILVVGGEHVVALLYDDRYIDAGWMLQILAAGMVFTIVGRYGPLHIARGESFIAFVAAAMPALFFLSIMFPAWTLWGTQGIVGSLAATYGIQYPVEVWIARRYGVWMPAYDALGFGSSIVAIGSGLAFLHTMA